MNRNEGIGAEKGFYYQTKLDYWSCKIVKADKSKDIKNQTFYFFNEMINFQVFDSLKIDKWTH